MKAQEKIRGANVLLIQMRGLANEIAKNLVLAGIGRLTIIDHAQASEADRGAQFLLPSSPEIMGQNRAEACLPNLQNLNPRVNISCDTTDVRSKDSSFFKPFGIIIATDIWDPRTLNTINTAARDQGIPFYAAAAHGLYGYIFADLVEHEFVVEREASNKVTAPGTNESRTCTVTNVQRKRNDSGKNVEMVTFHEVYSSFVLSNMSKLPEETYRRRNRLRAVSPALPCLRALFDFCEKNNRLPNMKIMEDIQQFTALSTAKKNALLLPEELKSEFLRAFLQGVGTEVTPTTAILGGQVAQDVINVLGGSQQPIQNVLIFDGDKMECSVYSLHPEGALGKMVKEVENGISGEVVTDSAPAAGAASVVVPVLM